MTTRHDTRTIRIHRAASGKLESDMREAAKRFEFEKAAKLRDTIKELRTKEFLFA